MKFRANSIGGLNCDSLFREAFREQAISHGVADDCVIDKDTYAEISCITGCFKSGNVWIVYDTDEHSQIYAEKTYLFPRGAYAEAAHRLGFIFQAPNLTLESALYTPQDALSMVCKTATAKFDETVELHVKLGVDSRHADQQVRGAIVLPHGTGKIVRVLVFAKGDKAEAAKTVGADYVGEMDLVEKILKENWFDFDVVVASPDMMGVVGRLGKLLGPKGLMPSPKFGTVTPDVAKAVTEIKAGKIEYRLDKTNIIHCPIGKVSFGPEKLTENYNTLMGAIVRAKPATAKGQYIRSCVTSSTMGGGVRIKIEQHG